MEDKESATPKLEMYLYEKCVQSKSGEIESVSLHVVKLQIGY